MSKEKLKTNAYTEKTSENYVIDTAVIYTDIELLEDEFQGKLLGATAGGTKISITPEYEDIELDGTSHMKVKGNKKLVSATATVTANLKELTVEVLRKSLNAKVIDANPLKAPKGYKQVEMGRRITDEAYIENIAFVGRMSGTDKPILFILDNALVISPLEIDTADNTEAVVEVEFEAHASVKQLHTDEWPWRILYPGPETTAEDGED